MLESIEALSGSGTSFPIHGRCDPRFRPVLDAFRANFEARQDILECGASVALVVDGLLVVDLWGGWQDAACLRPWREDTIVNMMSVGKAVAAVAVHMLADERLLDLDAPVARYWPSFGQAGKDAVPLRYVLDHRAGLPVVTASLPRGSYYDWDTMAGALAAQAPLWIPGEAAGYHILTQGFILGEVVARASGMPFAAFVRERITGPLGLDYHFGLDGAAQARCATFLQATEGTIFAAPPDTLLGQAWAQLNVGEDFNSLGWRSLPNSSAHGHGNARAVARFFGALARGGEVDGVRLLSGDAMRRMTAIQHTMTEQVMGRTYNQALGLLRNSPHIIWMGPNRNAFGHHGVGGSLGMADPDARLGFSYAMNQMHARYDNGPRARRLIEAAYACL